MEILWLVSWLNIFCVFHCYQAALLCQSTDITFSINCNSANATQFVIADSIKNRTNVFDYLISRCFSIIFKNMILLLYVSQLIYPVNNTFTLGKYTLSIYQKTTTAAELKIIYLFQLYRTFYICIIYMHFTCILHNRISANAVHNI